MGWDEYGSMKICDKALYERIKSCLLRHPNIHHNDEWWASKDSWQYYCIDLAKFFGIRETLYGTPEDTELSEEEKEKLKNLSDWSRLTIGYIFDWNENEPVGASIFLTGWKCYCRGLFTYISKMFPNNVFEVYEDNDSDFEYCYGDDDNNQGPPYKKILVNGKWFDGEEEYKAYLKEKNKGNS